MEHTEQEYRDLFREAFPDQVLGSLVKAVVDGYGVTPRACRRALDTPDQHDAFGAIRRGKINEQLRGVAGRFQFASADEPNENGSTHFLSIFSGLRAVCRQGFSEAFRAIIARATTKMNSPWVRSHHLLCLFLN